MVQFPHPSGHAVTWGGLNSSTACCFFHETNWLNIEGFAVCFRNPKNESPNQGCMGAGVVGQKEWEEQVRLLEGQGGELLHPIIS